MDGFDEKKWFVYLGDHHEGPFSLREIGERMAQGTVTAAHYVWCDGMADWKVMTETPAFESLLHGGGAAASLSGSIAVDSSPSVSVEIPALAMDTGGSTQTLDPGLDATMMTHTDTIPRAESPQEIQETPASTTTIDTSSMGTPFSPQTPKAKAKRKGLSKGFLFVASLLLCGGGIMTAYFQGMIGPDALTPLEPVLQKLVEWVPPLGNVFSPIGALEDVTPEDLKELRNAAHGPANQAALVASKADPLAPVVYVASSLPDGTTLDIVIVGNPDTLLNQTHFEAKLTATLMKHLGRSQSLRALDNKALPRGEYSVSVLQGSTTLARKTLFLGGLKDANYESRLKEFHDRLKEKATLELAELRQFAETLSGQLTSTVSKFDSLHRGKVTSVHRKVWNGFHNQWIQLTQKLVQTTQSWTPDALAQEYYYGALYRLVQDSAQQVVRVHDSHHSYFVGLKDTADFDAQLMETVKQAEATLNVLRTRLEKIEKTAESPSGLPRKDVP